MNKFGFQSLNSTYEDHLIPSKVFVENITNLRMAITSLVNLETNEGFEGQYANNVKEYMNTVVNGAITAMDIAKEMYNYEFQQLINESKLQISNGELTVLASESLENVNTYSKNYSNDLVSYTNQLNNILIKMRDNNVATTNPRDNSVIYDNHAATSRKVEELLSSLVSFSALDFVARIENYFKNVSEFVDFMESCISNNPDGSITYNIDDLANQGWYIKYTEDSFAFYEKMDLDYFARIHPDNMNEFSWVVVSTKLLEEMMKEPINIEAIESFLSNMLTSAAQNNYITDLEKIFNTYASVMLEVIMITADLLLVIGTDEMPELRDKLRVAGELFALFTGLSNNALGIIHYVSESWLVDFNSQQLKVDIDYTHSGTNGIFNIVVKPERDGISTIDILEFSIMSGTSFDMTSSEFAAMADAMLKEAQNSLKSGMTSLSTYFLIHMASKNPYVAIAIVALEGGITLFEIITARAGLSAAELESMHTNMKGLAGYLQCDVISTGFGYIYLPSDSTLNILSFLNQQNGTNFLPSDLNDQDKLQQIVDALKDFINENKKVSSLCVNLASLSMQDRSKQMEENIRNHGNPCGL